VGVAPFDPKQLNEADLAEIRSALEKISGEERSLVRLAGPNEAADVYVLSSAGGVLLRRPHDVTSRVTSRGTQSVAATAETSPTLFDPIKREGNWQQQLGDSLNTMARAINLRRLVTSDEELRAGESYATKKIDLKVTVEKLDRGTKKYEAVDPSTLSLTDRDKVRLTVANEGRVPVDVTILYVESAYAIRSSFPTVEESQLGFNNQVLPGNPPEVKPAVVQLTINDTTVGMEDIIIIAVASDPALAGQNFAFLEQKGLEQARETVGRARGRGKTVLNTPLGELLWAASYATGTRGGSNAVEVSNYTVRRVSWHVRKRDAPTAGNEEKR
jgi:hypothetical protein